MFSGDDVIVSVVWALDNVSKYVEVYRCKVFTALLGFVQSKVLLIFGFILDRICLR